MNDNIWEKVRQQESDVTQAARDYQERVFDAPERLRKERRRIEALRAWEANNDPIVLDAKTIDHIEYLLHQFVLVAQSCNGCVQPSYRSIFNEIVDDHFKFHPELTKLASNEAITQPQINSGYAHIQARKAFSVGLLKFKKVSDTDPVRPFYVLGELINEEGSRNHWRRDEATS